MKLKYVGPFDEVEVPSLGLTCKRLDVVEVKGEPARSLREQSDWEWLKPAPAEGGDESEGEGSEPEVETSGEG
jgi:hypothetical protein